MPPSTKIKIQPPRRELSPLQARTFRAYRELSPQARAEIDVLLQHIVTTIHKRQPTRQFGKQAALELLGALIELGAL